MGFTFVVNFNWEHLGHLCVCVCVLSFFLSVPGGGRLFSLVSVSLGCRCLENSDLSAAFWGMDRKPQSFSLAVCCVIQLWNDGIIARSAHFKLSRVLTHILGKCRYSPCNPQSVLVRIFSSLPLLCPLEKAAVAAAEMST